MTNHMKDWKSDGWVVAWLRRWPEESKQHGHFGWPTDTCGYEQHLRFLRWYRLEGIEIGEPLNACLIYADKLERGEIPEAVLPELDFGFGELT